VREVAGTCGPKKLDLNIRDKAKAIGIKNFFQNLHSPGV